MINGARSKATIDIIAGDGAGTRATVPITERSTRRFKLMEEDSVTLVFTLATAVEFRIGDYISDQIFGVFYVTRQQMPKFNTATGGYDYELTLEAPYRRWGQWLFMFTHKGARKEANWRLTGDLEMHAKRVLENVETLGAGSYGLDVTTAEKAQETRYLQYAGTDILTALDMMADAWECEWWVKNNVLHFGKCEDGSDPAGTFEFGGNVESMDIADNRSDYATRIYAWGGTKNVPDTYDRELVFTATNVETATDFEGKEHKLFFDRQRRLSLAMLSATANVFSRGLSLSYDIKTSVGVVSSESVVVPMGGFKIEGQASVTVDWRGTHLLGGTPKTFKFSAHAEVWANDKILLTSKSKTCEIESQTNPDEVGKGDGTQPNIGTIDFDLTSNDTFSLNAGDVVRLYVSINGDFTNGDFTDGGTDSARAEGALTVTANNPLQATKTLKVDLRGSHPAKFNPLYRQPGEQYYDALELTDSGTVETGDTFTIPDNGLTLKVPESYYSISDYDSPSAIASVGEKRIHMPKPAGGGEYVPYVDCPSYASSRLVERAVVFEDVYPKLILTIAELNTAPRTQTEELEDGSKRTWPWTAYIFKCDGHEFKNEYILDGHELEAVFTSGKLAGMTFKVGFDNDSQEFTIIRNSDYGAMLPCVDLAPAVGDELFLTGWNPRAEEGLGLVGIAEAELKEKAKAYAAAIEDGQFTFTCRMMSDWPFTLRGASAKLNTWRLPTEGAPVTILHQSLPNGSKTSRVIGYEFKLDMPFDSPIYTIGETQAFSRLARIEKELTKLS